MRDFCTLFPEGWGGQKWGVKCCKPHDEGYARGDDRAKLDSDFHACMLTNSPEWVADGTYYFVWVFGWVPWYWCKLKREYKKWKL